jgi:hypothetical protein
LAKYHKELAAGRWFKFSLPEQMGNIGSEVHRSINWFLKKDDRFQAAFERALELFDLTLKDRRWKEIQRDMQKQRNFLYIIN